MQSSLRMMQQRIRDVPSAHGDESAECGVEIDARQSTRILLSCVAATAARFPSRDTNGFPHFPRDPQDNAHA